MWKITKISRKKLNKYIKIDRLRDDEKWLRDY